MSRYRVTIHPAGMAGIAAACLFVPVDKLIPAVLAVVIHESGHVLAMWICGVERCRIEWTPVGFVAQTEGYDRLPAARRFWVAAGGIVASGVGCLVCMLFAGMSHFCYLLLTANLSLCLFNGLPALPLDGSKMLIALAAKAGLERKTERFLLAISYAVAAALCLLGIYGAMAGEWNPLLLLVGPYLAYAAKTSVRDSAIGTIQRLAQKKRLSEEKLYPVCSYVAAGEPGLPELLRAVRKCPENAYLLIHQVDTRSGAVQSISTETQIAQMLFQEHEMISKLHRHGKSDVIQ